jgi:SAM-dependent methyltransferase/predicted O-methyltransferase YrrM
MFGSMTSQTSPAGGQRSPDPGDGELRGLARVSELVRRWRGEKEDPEPFYSMLAAEAVADLERRHGSMVGMRIADLGCGPGYYTHAFRAHGANVIPIDGSLDELSLAESPPPGAVIADAGRLPLADLSVDGVFCSNLLEHTPDASAVIRDMERVLRPGGWGYLSWTNWYSPWGGHDMTPYQYLGPVLGPRLYERRHGPPRKNRYGEGLFAVHVGPTLRILRSCSGLHIDRVEPRYWPWASFIMRVPGAREVFAWNCLVRFRKVADDTETGDGASFRAVVHAVRDVEGWMSDDQARRLWNRARAVPRGGSIVEIGSYRGRSAIVLAKAAPPSVRVIAIDPHAGNDRGPQQWIGTREEGQHDYEQFHENLRTAGVEERVHHIRDFSQDAVQQVDGEVDMLYIDGAHGYAPARADIVQWGGRVRAGGTMLIHDAYSAVGVTLALLTTTVAGTEFRYVGRSGSMTEYRRESVRGIERVRNGLRQVGELGWFARNLAVKLALVGKARWLARLLGHRGDEFPY